jgi:hypothetical protein
MENETSTRREFIKKGTYVAPAILTLPATLSIASAGSGSSSVGSGGHSRRSSGGAEWWEFWRF